MTNRLTRAELLRRAALGGAAAAAPGLLAGTAQGATRIARAQGNGNKPTVPYANAFSQRVAEFPRIAYYPLLEDDGGEAAVAMVIDEILVGEKAVPYLKNLLKDRIKKKQVIDTGQTVFGGLKPAPSEDVHIWRLKQTPGNQDIPDVAKLVWDARKKLASKIPPEQVAPNHVLIPSYDYHTCPGGPPEPTTCMGTVPPRDPRAVEVVVIDSGYVADRPTALPKIVVERGRWFTATPVPGSPGLFKAPYKWIAEPAEPPYVTVQDIDGKDHLATLVAHANFVAGVIAQACKYARITLVNHNGGLLEKPSVADTPIPTEASVARSLWKHRKAPVINVGFAFPTLPRQPQVLKPSVPSWSFELALRGTNPKRTVVVAPAGNQKSPTPQYPAAFHLNRAHPNVIGVGSIGPDGQRSSFSNHGDSINGNWVACCTEGEDVLSTFISHWVLPGPPEAPRGPTEDAEPDSSYPDKKFNTGWAKWSGTSFASPKVAAAIAKRVAAGQSPLAAWLALPWTNVPGLQMGRVMSALPPTTTCTT